ATWLDGTRKRIDAAIPPATTGHYKGRVSPQSKTRARAEQLPPVLRALEESVSDAGYMMSVKVDGVDVPLRPSHIYDAVEDLGRILRAEQGIEDGARAVQRQADIVLFNPGTAAPDTLLHEG